MDFQDVVRKRRMVRNFEERPIPPDMVERILDNAQHSPSAGFSQGFEFLVLQSEEERQRFWAAVSPDRGWERQGWPGVYNAPLLIVPLAHKQAYLDRYAEPDKAGARPRGEADWQTPYWYVDTGMAALLMLLTAVDARLGALFFGLTDIPTFCTAFGVPEAYHPIGVLAIGYPLPDRPSYSLKRGRRAQAAIVHRGQW
ncbi:MAG: nitroreductase family protein [Dehalococcoidia bacterium]